MTTNMSSLHERHLMQSSLSSDQESQELSSVLQQIVQNAGALLEVSSCSVALADVTGSVLITQAALPQNGFKPRYTRFHLNEGVAGWVAEHREPLVIDDVQHDPRFKRLGRMPVGSMICVPLMDNDQVIGTLTASSPEKNAFSARQLQMLTIFAEQAVLAITNAHQAQQLRAIVTSSSDGIALIGAGRRFIEANPAFGRIFGLDPQQVIGMECVKLFGCDDECFGERCRDLCMIQKAIQQGQALPYMEVEMRVNGSPRSIGLSITPVSTMKKPLCLVIARDVTAVRDTMRMKANFLSMITHELRSPINAIHGYLDLALEGVAGELNKQQREFVLRARASSEYLYALVEDVLLVARADAGQVRLNRELASLQEIVDNAVEELELMATDNQITVNVDVPQNFPQIYVDAVRLQQVLRNLVSNALRFTSPGGQVTIAASIVPKMKGSDREGAMTEREGAMAEASSATTGAYSQSQEDSEMEAEVTRLLKLQVSDTGRGIAPEHQERIFERFYQVPSNGGRASGQGLGLAIVKMIVELHGGQVSVESVPGQGSTFTCLLPCVLS